MDAGRSPKGTRLDRRDFLGAAAASIAAGAATRATGQVPSPAPSPATAGAVEWRNKQPGMAYRRLGRTGLMISEVVSGGDPITLENYKHLELALEMGLNYLDMAPAYNRGDTERAYGKLIAGSSSKRDKVFLATKVSNFTRQREQKYKEIFDGLPTGKQEAIVKKAKALRAERGVEAPGYYLTYFPNQQRAFEPSYLRIAMMDEYAGKVEGDPAFGRFIAESLEGSLQRLGTDHVDILMCPHGANAPEDFRVPEIAPIFQDLKKQGKVRFLGLTAHNDPAGNLRAAADLGYYDVMMLAYNVINGGYVDAAIRHAAAKDMGLIAMKAAHAVATHHKALQPVPDWRVAKVDRIVPGEMKAPLKAYLWALQNPRIAAVISNLWDDTHVRENLALAGKSVELRPA